MSTLVCDSIMREDNLPIKFVNSWININHIGNAVRNSGGISSFTNIAAGKGRITFIDTMPIAVYSVAGCSTEGEYKDTATTRSAGVIGPLSPYTNANAFLTTSFSFQTSAYTPDNFLSSRETWLYVLG